MVRLFWRKKEKVEAGVKKTRRTWFGRVAGLLRRSRVDEALWDELEEALISADVGTALTERLLATVKERTRREGASTGEAVSAILQDEMVRVLEKNPARSSLAQSEEGYTFPARPYVVLVIGVNGAGKTTSIAKLAHMLTEDGKKVVLAAGDTFRAAGIEQLGIWGQRAGAEVIAHSHGSDPGAVTFDALQAARGRGSDVVIIDTAGRLHTKTNLMEELKKVHRVVQRFDAAAPHETVLVLDATTGQNGLAQARAFAEAVGITGLFIAKLDGSAKGGVVLSIADQLGLPILFIGTGEQLDDVAPFDAREYVEALFSSEG
jgi:fused signal recognition particle receptor